VTDLLVLGLGCWVVWEWLLSITPLRIPVPLQPLVVAGLAVGVLHAPQQWRTVLAVAAVVAILHAYLQAEMPARRAAVRSRTRRARHSAIPDLPKRK